LTSGLIPKCLYAKLSLEEVSIIWGIAHLCG
jgi:hypothetical protein